jgi:uncharacterized protein with PIN domain
MPRVHTASFRFYAELNDFLPAEPPGLERRHGFEGRPAVKDAIEAQGVPHTKVELILRNGESVSFAEPLRDGDRVAVYPVFESFDLGPALAVRREPLREPRFVVDVNLGKLARRLRLLGFDTRYRNDFADPEVVRIAVEEGRIVLTRDRCLDRIGLIEPVAKAAVQHRLEPGTRRHYDEFYQCRGCAKVYWRGPHVDRLVAAAERVLDRDLEVSLRGAAT